MATARDMIDSALRLTGVKAPGETATNGEAADALEVWNDLLDALALENLMLYGNENETFNLVANQQSYTIGPSGNFNTKRPVEIRRGLGIHAAARSNQLPGKLVERLAFENAPPNPLIEKLHSLAVERLFLIV